MEYFQVCSFEILCNVSKKREYYVIVFEEKNEIPNGYPASEYESKGFMESQLIQDFPLRGKAVFLKLRKRRWRHKQTGVIIKRDFTFMADGSKFTQELSDFLKDGNQYARRYHQ
jgi:transposase